MPAEIEVFRAGTRASRGITASDIAQVAAYDCSSRPVPLCFGHPADDTPNAGTVIGFRADGNSLFAKIGSMTQKAIDGIKSGAWLNRSMAFFHPTDAANPTPGRWAPRHLGLLGGSAPGIPGMDALKAALAFDAGGDLVAFAQPADAIVSPPASRPTPIFIVHDAPRSQTMTHELKTGAEMAREAQALAKDKGITFDAALAQVSDVRPTQRVTFAAGAPKPTGRQIIEKVRAMMAADRSLTFDAAVARFA